MEQRLEEFNKKMTDAVNNPIVTDVPEMAIKIFGGAKDLPANEIMMMQLYDTDADNEVLFQMLFELVLHGIDIISNGTTNIFDLSGDQYMIKGAVDNINSYIEKFGIQLKTYTASLPIGAASQYREWEDYYCELMRKNPHSRSTDNQWVVLEKYIVHQNEKFTYNQKTTPINYYRFVLRPKNSSLLFYFYFEFKIAVKTTGPAPEKTTMLL